ncbi:MAG: alpha-galactosidase [Lachnospiraceae bacterium]|nr:alpha-galactosidase [Lachnospiraceae bacterium]
MKSNGEIKLVGDAYPDSYSNGLTMIGSATKDHFKINESSYDRTTYKSDDGLTLIVNHVKSALSDATTVFTTFINNSGAPVTLEMMTSFLLPDIPCDKLYRIQSFWSAEGRVKCDTLASLNMEHAWNNRAYRVEKFGNLGSMPVRRYFPFVALEDSKTGTFTGVMLYAPSSWQIEVIVRKGDTATLAGGLADRDFGQWLKTVEPGESFTSPRAILASGKSLDEVCDKLVKAQNPKTSPVDNKMGIIFNEYCTTWGNPNIDNLKRLADKIADKGIQYLVMDSGWYSDCGNWWEYRGDWSINRKRFPNGLKELTDYIRSKGMIPGIWFELEVASPKAPIYEDEEMFVKKDGRPLTVGDVHFLDMENQRAREFLRKNVIDTLKNNGFGYIKVDYNDTMGAGCDGPDAPGENLRRKVLATEDFFKEMVKEIPELVIENCSSGGHRLEPSFMELSSQASFSDAHEIPSLPLIAANLHRVIRPEQSQIWAVMRPKDSDERMYYSLCATLLGRMGLSGDIYDLSEHQWDILDEGMVFYKESAHIIKDGHTTVNIADTLSYNEPTGSQLVIRETNEEVLLVYHRFADSSSLDEYLEKNDVKIAKYKEIQRFGVADKDFSAEAIRYRK